MKKIQTAIAKIWIDEQRIIHIVFENETHPHGLKEAQEIVRVHNELARGVPCGIIADIRNTKIGANRAAREHYVSEEGARLKTGMAMIVSSAVQKMLANIFFRISRPPYPTKMFTDTNDAIVWLHEISSTKAV